MIITISGNAGSGKDTIGNLLGEKLGLRVIRGTMKTFTQEKGIDILEFDKEIAKDETGFWDKKLDSWQKEEVRRVGDCILVSMLGAYNIPKADLKIWLGGREEVRALRIAKRDRRHVDQALAYLQERDRISRERVKRVYKIDFWNPKFYDLRIDTSNLTPEQIVAKIIKKLNES